MASSPPEPFSIPSAFTQIQSVLSASPSLALPPPKTIHLAASKIHASLPASGLGPQPTLAHILTDLTPGFNGSKTSPHYYGFVTGGVLPIAEAADRIVSAWDQNAQVHLRDQSVATSVEWAAGGLLVEVLGLSGGGTEWLGRTFTTGATGSNVLGLACGREAVLGRRLTAVGATRRVQVVEAAEGGGNRGIGRELEGEELEEAPSIGDIGLLEACRLSSVDSIQVLTTMGHSSLSKAASIVGLGRQSVKDVGLASQPWKFDMQRLEEELRKLWTASIVVVSCGEVNTGRYATSGFEEMKGIRELCDRYGAWLHVDGAFGLFARALPEGEEFAVLRKACEGIELADSITGDAHKCLNVPYDCGFFLTPSPTLLTSVFQNPNAAYLSTNSSNSEEFTIPSPLNIGIENSRRFRALPVYAVLLSHGRAGLADIFARQVRLARLIAAFVDGHAGYELLPSQTRSVIAQCQNSKDRTPYAETGIIVLFRAVDPSKNTNLAARINRSGKIMVSGTVWEGWPAVRIAVSTWMVEEERDLKVVRAVLEEALS